MVGHPGSWLFHHKKKPGSHGFRSVERVDKCMSPCANVCQFVSSNQFLFLEMATSFWLSFSWRNHALVKNQESFINEQTIPTCIISHSFRALGAEISIAFAYQLRYSNMSDAGEMLVPYGTFTKTRQTKTSVCKSILAKCAANTNCLRLPRRIHILFNRLTHLDKRNAGVSGYRRLSYRDKLVSKKCGELNLYQLAYHKRRAIYFGYGPFPVCQWPPGLFHFL